MSQRPHDFQQPLHHERHGKEVLLSQANGTSLPMHSGDDAEVLAAIAATHVPALSDDLFNVIRAIVPPPPTENVSCRDALCNRLSGSLKPDILRTEKLYTRRPTEETLLERLRCQLSFLEQTKTNMEELFIQIIEPKRYRNHDEVKDLILTVLWKWPTNSTVLEQTFACLVCMSGQCSDLCLSLDAVASILKAMKSYPKNEQIQRFGIKLFKNRHYLSLVKKVDVACMIFDSLCNLPDMDDLMISAEYFIRELDSFEKTHIRTFKKYIEMLLNFPYRRNYKITVCLCWSALDILIMLAECSFKWDLFIDIGGVAIVQMLSVRPELEDRCKILLHKISSVHNNVLFSGGTLIQQKTPQADKHASEFTFSFKTASINQDIAKGIPRGLPAGSKFSAVNFKNKVENGQPCKVNSNISSDTEAYQNVNQILPVDEIVTQKPPTPPPTEEDLDDDVDGQFSDEECMQTSNSPHLTTRVSPLLLYSAPSPSYSPPPETSLSLEDERLALRELLSCGDVSRTARSSVRENTGKCEPMATVNNVIGDPSCDVVTKEKRNPNPASNGKLSSVFHCFICNQSKGRRPLLVQQLKQISHCLLQPCNSLLLNCLKSNLCEHHNL